MEGQKNLRALLPIGVFLLLYLGFGIIFEYVLKTEQGFYGVQAIVVFLIALLSLCFRTKGILSMKRYPSWQRASQMTTL